MTASPPPRWGWVWGNDQEGWSGWENPRWRAKRAGWPEWLKRIEYGAIRNRSSNLRFLGLFKPSPVLGSTYGNLPWRGGWWRVSWDANNKWLTMIEVFWKPGWFTKFGARLGPEWTKGGTNFAVRILGRY